MVQSLNRVRIIFIGTPDFAVPSLKAIVEAGFEVVAVITAPDKQVGRGLKIQPSPIKAAALQFNIPVLQPQNLKDPEFLKLLASFRADLQIVIAFRMLPEAVWNMPPKGTFNLHASLLPKYRGAAPIQRAIMNHETESGVTTFFLKHEIDTGDVLLQEKVRVSEDMTGGELHDLLMMKGASLVIKTLHGISHNSIYPKSQQFSGNEPLAPKIFHHDMQINWNWTGLKINDWVRALSPHPGAFFLINGMQLKVYKVKYQIEKSVSTVGTSETDGKTFWRVACSDAWIYLEEIQQQGKKRMGIRDFLNGDKGTLTQFSNL